MGYIVDSDILLDLIHNELITFLSTLNIMIPEDRRQHFEIAMGGIIKRAGELTDAETHDARGPWINIDDVKRDLGATCFARREESGELIALGSLEMYAEMRGLPTVQPDACENTCDFERKSNDTISRQDAIDVVKKNTFRLTFAEEQNCEGHVAWSANAVYSDVIEGALLELPSAQPSRKRGAWIPQDFNKSDGMKTTAVYYFPKCSVCGYAANSTNYCPNCGADMRGDAE